MSFYHFCFMNIDMLTCFLNTFFARIMFLFYKRNFKRFHSLFIHLCILYSMFTCFFKFLYILFIFCIFKVRLNIIFIFKQIIHSLYFYIIYFSWLLYISKFIISYIIFNAYLLIIFKANGQYQI